MADINVNITQPSQANVTIDRGLTGPAGPVGAGGALGYYGSFYSTGTHAIANVTQAQVIPIDITSESNGISIVDGNKVTFYHQATYSFTFSIQFSNSSNSIETATVWLKYNGVDYPFSSSHFDVPGAHAGRDGSLVGTVNFVATSLPTPGDYVQLYWAGTSTGLSIKTYPAGTSPVYPVSPCLILTVTQVMYLQTV